MGGLELNVLPHWLIEKLDSIPQALVEADGPMLEEMLQPDQFVRKVRLAFWREYERAMSNARLMEMSVIARELAVPRIHIESTLKNPGYLAYVCTPPGSYESFLDEALDHGLKRLRRELLDLPLWGENVRGEKVFLSKNADILLKAVAFLDVRKHGMPKQRIEQLNVHTSAKEMREMAQENSLAEIDKRIRELESQGVTGQAVEEMLKRGQALPSPDSVSVKPLDLSQAIDIEVEYPSKK